MKNPFKRRPCKCWLCTAGVHRGCAEPCAPSIDNVSVGPEKERKRRYTTALPSATSARPRPCACMRASPSSSPEKNLAQSVEVNSAVWNCNTLIWVRTSRISLSRPTPEVLRRARAGEGRAAARKDALSSTQHELPCALNRHHGVGSDCPCHTTWL